MEEANEHEINFVKRKFLEFQRNGLESYRDYLQKEFDRTPHTKLKAAYKRYVETELTNANAKISDLNEKLG